MHQRKTEHGGTNEDMNPRNDLQPVLIDAVKMQMKMYGMSVSWSYLFRELRNHFLLAIML